MRRMLCAFGVFDITDEAVFVFQLVVLERRHLGAAGFDVGGDEMRAVTFQGMAHCVYEFFDGVTARALSMPALRAMPAKSILPAVATVGSPPDDSYCLLSQQM